MPERAAPPRRGEGRPLPDRGGRMTAADLDLQAIARRAADAPPGMTPAALIDQALREAGVEGSYQTSRQYRRLWHQAAQYTCHILRERLLAAGVQASRTAGRGPRRAFRRRRYDRPIGDQVYEVLREAGEPLRLVEITARLNARGCPAGYSTVKQALRRHAAVESVGWGRYRLRRGPVRATV